VRLEHGGSNNVDNLVALCRDCHGKKTAMETF
jgi:5-methylcytosine-specific restriction endonuclease McrA